MLRKRNAVGARELKTRLGGYLRRVRQGTTIVVTDRGEPVAELRPLPGGSGDEAALGALESSGAVTRARKGALVAFRAIRGRGASAATAISGGRKDRF